MLATAAPCDATITGATSHAAMAKQTPTDIDLLAAPLDDGAVLIRPNAAELLPTAEANRRSRLDCRIKILGRLLCDWVRLRKDDPLVFMTGHQPEFFHPGVWAKNVVAARLASAGGGLGLFLTVDSDVPHSHGLVWPEVSDGLVRETRAELMPAPRGISYEQLPPYSDEAWSRAFGRLPARLLHDEASVLPPFAESFCRTTAEGEPSSPDYLSRWTRGLAAVDAAIGIRSLTVVRTSEIYSPSPTASRACGPAFVAHLLLHAGRFAAAYNAALAAYRRRRDVRGRQHPIPDLAVQGERIETPFWMIHSTQPRQRLAVSSHGDDAVMLWAGSEPICTLGRETLMKRPSGILADCLGHWRIRPRALAQTIYARLFACDLFVHGIGGAKYDQIADEVIRTFFDAEPPRYACVSATLRLALPTHGVTERDLNMAAQVARDLRFNPQRHTSGLQLTPPARSAIERREDAVRESTRLAREARHDRRLRRRAFDEIRQANAEIVRNTPALLERAAAATDLHQAEWASDRIALSREWFVALHPKHRLAGLCEDLPLG